MKQDKALSVYIEAFQKEGVLAEDQTADAAAPIRGVTYDSRQVVNGTLFFCKGATFKEEYVLQSAEKGALAYVSETAYDAPIPGIIVSDIKLAMAVAANIFFEEAWRRLHITAVTATKGKTTVTYFMRNVLDEYLTANRRPRSAFLSSIDIYDGVTDHGTHLTTPEALELHERFYNAAESGISYFSMEASSHALKYYRTWGVEFDVGMLLNIGVDHISPMEHDSVEDYVASKMKIFGQSRVALISMDQKHWEQALAEAEASPLVQRIFTFTVETEDHKAPEVTTKKPHARFTAYDLASGRTGSTFRVRGGDMDEEFSIRMPGIFNVSNALAVITAAVVYDIPVEYIRKGIAGTRVEGRMETFADRAEKKIVIADYAHNGISFEAVFDAARRDYKGMPIYCVFGGVGGKAFARRKDISTVAGKNADLVILTEDDPGPEDVVDLAKELGGYIEEVGGRYEIVPDRSEAIRRAILDSPEEALVLVLGKGQETTQFRNGVFEPYESDIVCIERCLAEYDG